jgi:hypothetical protein
MIEYEWTLERIDEHGDIIDSEFADSLAGSGFDLGDVNPGRYAIEGYDLGVVRNVVDESGCIEDRVWAYAKRRIGGKLMLSDCWSNGAGDMPNWKVPKKLHLELARWQRAWL